MEEGPELKRRGCSGWNARDVTEDLNGGQDVS